MKGVASALRRGDGRDKAVCGDADIAILKEAEAGAPAKELCRCRGFRDSSLYIIWRNRLGDREVSEAEPLNVLEQKNARLKKLWAKATLDKQALDEMPRTPY